MTHHYAEKYPSIEPAWLTIPITPIACDESGIARKAPTDDHRPTALYSGGTQAWQNLDAMLDLVESAGNDVDFRFLSHDHTLIEHRIEERELAHAPSVGHCDKTELPAAYREAEFGLVLRDDSPVNRVSCPTKLVEYLLFGLVPVVRSPRMGDFQERGFAYITEDELREGFIPDAASREWMVEHNLSVVRQLTGQFGSGARTLRAMLSDGTAREPRTRSDSVGTPIERADSGPSTRETESDTRIDGLTIDDSFVELPRFRRSVLDRHARFPCDVLEIGAYRTPTVDRSEANVKFLDYYGTEELKSMTAEEGGDPESVVHVDYVCRSDEYTEVVHEEFDVLIANHVLEHVDFMIRWLQMGRALIRDGGLLFLVLPDKKKSFDKFRPDTPLSHLLFEFLEPDDDASAIHTLETELYYDRSFVGEENDPRIRLDVERLTRALNFRPCPPGVHRHVFQAETFAGKIINPLLYMELLDYELLEVVSCPNLGEFAVVLKAGRDGIPPEPGSIFTAAGDTCRPSDTAPTNGANHA